MATGLNIKTHAQHPEHQATSATGRVCFPLVFSRLASSRPLSSSISSGSCGAITHTHIHTQILTFLIKLTRGPTVRVTPCLRASRSNFAYSTTTSDDSSSLTSRWANIAYTASSQNWRGRDWSPLSCRYWGALGKASASRIIPLVNSIRLMDSKATPQCQWPRERPCRMHIEQSRLCCRWVGENVTPRKTEVALFGR